MTYFFFLEKKSCKMPFLIIILFRIKNRFLGGFFFLEMKGAGGVATGARGTEKKRGVGWVFPRVSLWNLKRKGKEKKKKDDEEHQFQIK